MRKLHAFTISATVVLCMTIGARSICATADPPAYAFINQLSALAAQCELANRAYALSPGSSVAAVMRVVDQNRQCIESSKAKAKPHYKTALTAAPAAHDLIARVYARWLEYIEHVGDVAPSAAKAAAKRDYDTAANDLRAYVDAQ